MQLHCSSSNKTLILKALLFNVVAKEAGKWSAGDSFSAPREPICQGAAAVPTLSCEGHRARHQGRYCLRCSALMKRRFEQSYTNQVAAV